MKLYKKITLSWTSITKVILLLSGLSMGCQERIQEASLESLLVEKGIQDKRHIAYVDRGCGGCLDILHNTLSRYPDVQLVLFTQQPEKGLRLRFEAVEQQVHFVFDDSILPRSLQGDSTLYVSSFGKQYVLATKQFLSALSCEENTSMEWVQSRQYPTSPDYPLHHIIQAGMFDGQLYLSGHFPMSADAGIFKLEDEQWDKIYDLYSVDPKVMYPLGLGKYHVREDQLWIVSSLELLVWDIPNQKLISRQMLPLAEKHSTKAYLSQVHFGSEVIVIPIEYSHASKKDPQLYQKTESSFIVIDYQGQLVSKVGTPPDHLKVDTTNYLRWSIHVPYGSDLAYGYYGSDKVYLEEQVFSNGDSLSLPWTWDLLWPRISWEYNDEASRSSYKFYSFGEVVVMAQRPFESDTIRLTAFGGEDLCHAAIELKGGSIAVVEGAEGSIQVIHFRPEEAMQFYELKSK